jgi:cytoskeleton protein RodZ
MDIGAQLRAAREAKGLSIGTLAERTRVPARTLAAIERNDQSALPPHPFARGFVRTYAEEVDLDPDRLVRDFFAQFPAPIAAAPISTTTDSFDESWQPPSRWMGMGTAIAILLVVVAAAVVLGRRDDSTAGPETVGTTGASPTVPAPAPAAPEPAARAAAPVAAPATTAPSAAIEVVLSISRPCWVAATVDGRRAIYRTLQPGERETLLADRDLRIRFGDAGAVTWSINGRDGGRLGEDGAVRNVHLTPESAGARR